MTETQEKETFIVCVRKRGRYFEVINENHDIETIDINDMPTRVIRAMANGHKRFFYMEKRKDGLYYGRQAPFQPWGEGY